MHRLDITASDGLVTEILLDGEPLFADRITLTFDTKEMPVATIRMPYIATNVKGVGTVIHLDDETSEALIQLGWIPPEEEQCT